MSELTLANNNFTGNLYNMPKNLFLVETANNENLCGMVIPASYFSRNLLLTKMRLCEVEAKCVHEHCTQILQVTSNSPHHCA